MFPRQFLFVNRATALNARSSIHIAQYSTILNDCNASGINFEVLADSIKRHENGGVKFPYGVERRVNGRLAGYPEPIARQKCIKICREQYALWLKVGGDYFRVLGKRYAQDPNWANGVRRIYAANKSQ